MANNRIYNFSKRVFDVGFSLIVLLLILSWIVPLIAIIIRFESKGNPFFTQKRVGKDKDIFTCFKFRTMRINSTPEIQAHCGDNRVTYLGRILRYSGLDEIPQFINVLLGQMSVVGPRPHMIAHTEEFEMQIPEYCKRHEIKPGITGLAQIRGCRGEIEHISDLKARLKHDLNYINQKKLSLDIYIILISIKDLFKGAKNAY